jgi:peptide-methionine (R)-S-oxide reductase
MKILTTFLLSIFTGFAYAQTNIKQFEVAKTDAEWKKELSAEAYQVLRKKGTERAFTGMYWDHHESGTYCCAGCSNELFSSAHKFESGTGWPSFYKLIAKGKVGEESDNTHGMVRTEVICNKCGGHLGHVFDDGPQPTGLRYCINSVSLVFKKK